MCVLRVLHLSFPALILAFDKKYRTGVAGALLVYLLIFLTAIAARNYPHFAKWVSSLNWQKFINSVKQQHKTLIASCPIALICFLFVWESSRKITALGVWLLVAVIALSTAIELVRLLKDSIRLRGLLIVKDISRNDISFAFLSFNTRWGRFGYVQKIKNAKVKATGEWPEGHAPNLGDAASTLLAQLDEKWLGLDR